MTKRNRNEYQRIWARENASKYPIKRMLSAAKKRAKKKGLEFNLTEEDITLPSRCPYLGTTFNTECGDWTNREQTYSLDRIDSSKGYTKDNVEVISWLANAMKANATKEQLIEFAREVIKRYGSAIEEPSGTGRREYDQRKGQPIQSAEQTCDSAIKAGECSRCCAFCKSVPRCTADT